MPRLSKSYVNTARWFFLIIATITLYLFWKIVEPWALTLLAALIAAIVLGPMDRFLAKSIKSVSLRAILLVIFTLLIVILPLFATLIGIVSQSAELIESSFGAEGWVRTFDIHTSSLFLILPPAIQNELLSVDLIALGKTLAQWAITNVGPLFASTAQVLFQTLIFFIALFYFVVDRERLRARILQLSPFQNMLDETIMRRMTGTVRSVVLSAIVVSVIKGALAAVGMTIFGVPGALLWGALSIIASQIPMVGTSLITIPACIYLFLTGDFTAAIGLTIWSVLLVGLADNFLSPMILKGRTNMHPLLILISILGGLQFLGPIGLIIGPVILAAVMVVVEMYENGVLEHGA